MHCSAGSGQTLEFSAYSSESWFCIMYALYRGEWNYDNNYMNGICCNIFIKSGSLGKYTCAEDN